MSFLDSLRAMVGFKKSEPAAAPKKHPTKERVGAFSDLSTRFLACQNEEEKASLWASM